MTTSAHHDLAATVTAHDKLLKALIGLLAVKDRHLLEDLRAVFAMLDHAYPAEARTWAQVRRDLDVIGDMLAGDDADDPDAERPTH